MCVCVCVYIYIYLCVCHNFSLHELASRISIPANVQIVILISNNT